MLGSWFHALYCSLTMIKKGNGKSGFLCVFLYYTRVSPWMLFKKGWYACSDVHISFSLALYPEYRWIIRTLLKFHINCSVRKHYFFLSLSLSHFVPPFCTHKIFLVTTLNQQHLNSIKIFYRNIVIRNSCWVFSHWSYTCTLYYI